MYRTSSDQYSGLLLSLSVLSLGRRFWTYSLASYCKLITSFHTKSYQGCKYIHTSSSLFLRLLPLLILLSVCLIFDIFWHFVLSFIAWQSSLPSLKPSPWLCSPLLTPQTPSETRPFFLSALWGTLESIHPPGDWLLLWKAVSHWSRHMHIWDQRTVICGCRDILFAL